MSEEAREAMLQPAGLRLVAVGTALIILGCGGDDATAPTFGSLEITTATSGPEPDADGYTLTIDGGAELAIGPNATLRRDNLESGNHLVHLGGTAANCVVAADNPRTIGIIGGQTATVAFAVSCNAAATQLVLTTQPPAEGKSGVLLSRQPVVQLGDRMGRPVARANVAVEAELASGFGVLDGTTRIMTDANGRAAFGDLVLRGLPGARILRFEAQDYAGVTSQAVLVAAADPAQPIDLGTLDGFESSDAWAINNNGMIVGSSTIRGYPIRAVVWENHKIRDIGGSGDDEYESRARDVNDAGQVVGYFDDGEGRHAFLWQNGVRTDLGTLEEGGWSEAYAINNSGVIVGTASGHAVIWNHGQILDLGTLPAPFNGGSEATAINDRGQVVGTSGFRLGVVHGFIWENGTMTDLGALRPYFINNRGQVIGGPFLWENGVTKDLSTLNGRQFFPHAINDNGILYGVDQDGARWLWQEGRTLRLPDQVGSGGWEDNNRGEVLTDYNPDEVSQHGHAAVLTIDRATIIERVP